MNDIKEMIVRLAEYDEEFKKYDARHHMLVELAEENLNKMKKVAASRAELGTEIVRMTKSK